MTAALAALLAAGALAPVAAAAPPPPAAATTPAGNEVTTALTEAEAVRLAKETGKAVPIQDKNTETTEVLANPSGSFTLRSNARPVRVEKDGAWRGIDTTLRSNPDGTVAPVASAVDIAFSGGGDVPIARVAEGDGSLSVKWPGKLPKPVLSGNTATYPDVLPGVDLKMIAEADTYIQTLVVRDRQAARNPELAALKQTVTATNFALHTGEDGRVSAMDKDGNAVFVGSAPRMWDSSHDPQVGPAPTEKSAGGAKVNEIRAAAKPLAASTLGRGGHSSVEMVLTPDAAALTGPDVKYPLFIDPHFARNRENWTEVTTNANWTPKWRTPDPVRVGRCYNRKLQCGGTWTARSYFSFGFWDLKPRNGVRPILFTGSFIVGQLHSSHNCEHPEPTDLHAAGGFDSGTRWGGPLGRYLETQWSNAQVDCGGGRAVKYNAISFVQEGVDHGYTGLNFGLRAPDEGNDLQWKVFDNNPVLEVEFSYPPNKAYNLRVSNAVNCNGKVVTPDAHPVLYATATDNNDPPLNPALWYHVVTADESRQLGSGGGVRVHSGTEGGWREPDNLGNGDYKFRVYVDNNPGHPHNTNAGYSDWYHFTTRSSATPAVAPTIEPSVDYPKNYWGAPYGAPSNISVRSNGAPNTVGYAYTFMGSGTAVKPAPESCHYKRVFGNTGGWIPHNENGPNWIPVPPDLPTGYHTLHVQSFDDAHNMSLESEAHTFYVPPQVAHAAKRVEAENMPQSQPAGQNRPVETQADPNGGSSNNANIWFQGNAPGQSLSLSFDTNDDADFNLSLGLTRAQDFGKLVFEVDGQRLGDPTFELDTYNSTWQTSRHNLGVRRLVKGTHVLTIRVVGTNPKSLGGRYTFGVDYLALSQTARSEAEDPGQVTLSQPPNQNVPTVNVPRDPANPAYTPSQGGAIGFMATEPNKSIDFTFRTRVQADYALGAGLAKGPEGGLLRISVNGRPVIRTDETPWDSYDGGRGFSTYQPLGGVHLTAGLHRLTITVTGKNAASRGYKALVDYITAVPINNVRADNFTAAMNNDGIGPDGTRVDFDLSYSSLSAQNLAAAGYGPGAAVTVNGATFTMPAARADGADNVIAIGQTIPFPAEQQVKSTAIGLLAASTCGSTKAATATIHYADENGSTQDSRVPPLTDWIFQDTEDAAVVLPYWNLSGVPTHREAPRLTALFVPTDPTKVVKAITLPNYGTNLLPGSCSPALHVMAMAPRPVAGDWIGAWAAPADAAKPTPGGVGFANQTVRSVLKPKVTGPAVRVRVANPHANIPVTIGAASIGAQTGTGSGLAGPPVALAFGGKATVTLPAGGEALSDPVATPVGGTGNLTVSLHLPNAVPYSPAHLTSNDVSEPTVLANGNATTDTSGTPFTTLMDGPRYLSGVLVSTSENWHGTVAVLGDQLTATAPPGANGSTWVDRLPGKLEGTDVPLPGGLVNASREGVLPAGLWRLDDGSGTTARDAAGSSPLTLNGGATWSSERGGSIAFDGTGTAATAPRPPFVTDYSYTVSAWVKITNGAPEQTVFDAEGNNNFGFSFRYTGGATPKWAFHVSTEDKFGGPYVSVLSTVPAESNVWTHLVVSYNAPGKAARLWVNGVYQTAVAVPWAVGATRRFVVGRDLRGLVSDVRAYQTAANDFDVDNTRYGVPGAPLGFGAPTAFLASRSLDRTVQAQPNLRTVIVSLGANDVLAGMGPETVKQSLTRLMHTSSPTSPRHTRRLDGNPVRVVVTTIPPLGLSADDPREQRRREINADLLTNYLNYGANDVVDIAVAVADPAHPHQVRPGYLTGGKRNAEYHDAVAQTIATAVTTFPPRVQL